MTGREKFKIAYQGVRLKLLAMAAHAEYDYTVYDGWCDDGDGYNRDGQSKQDWNDAVDRQLWEQEMMAERAEELLSKLEIDPVMAQAAASCWYENRHAHDKYPLAGFSNRVHGWQFINRDRLADGLRRQRAEEIRKQQLDFAWKTR